MKNQCFTLRLAVTSLYSAMLFSCFDSTAHAQTTRVPRARAPLWEPVPLITPESRRAGHSGGEGAQWPRAVAADGTGDFVLFGSDVGGIFRSLNGGANWEPCNVGYHPRGTAGMAIDPRNANRCLSVGANSVSSDMHGIYLSTDKAASWKQVFKANLSGSADNREQLAYDPGTYDAKLGYTRVVYWSRIADDKAHYGTPEIHPALYKSLDGGQSWSELPNSSAVGGSLLKVHPTAGVIYAANNNGFYRSADGGASFTRVMAGDFTGLDVSKAAPNNVYVCKADGVWRSTDSGQTFVKLPGTAAIANGDVPRNVKVSPVNANNMVLWREGANYNWPRFHSTDGGASWQQSKFDNTHAFLPHNARQGLFAWHPRNENVAWSTGGDWPTMSRDKGGTWKYSGDGYNVILVGGTWNFNTQNPDVLFFGSQDYNGALTTDGGATWKYLNVSGNGWGGFCYGGYAASPGILYAGNAAGWGEPRKLKVSHDGGATFTETGLAFSGPDVSYSDPTNPAVLFASNLRSADGGRTWKPMTGCDAVYTSNPRGARELYGKLWNKDTRQSTLLKSTDKGASWMTVAALSGSIDDIACDPVRRRVYVANEGALKYWSGKAWTAVGNLPKDQWDGNRIRSVAVDPVNPAIVYAASNRDVFCSNASVLRSTDAGTTWENLTVNTPLHGKQRDGGREALCIRVHPRTRYAWVSTSCYGIWKIAPPP